MRREDGREYVGARIPRTNASITARGGETPPLHILDPQFLIFLIFFLFFVIFLLIKLALLRLFIQITYAFFTQEHLRAAVGGAEAEGVFVVVAHETAHSFAGVEHDDDRDLGGHQL